jgi:hypothetical protein
MFIFPPVPPAISMPQKTFNATAERGEEMTLSCRASGSPEPSISWSRWVSNHVLCLVSRPRFMICLEYIILERIKTLFSDLFVKGAIIFQLSWLD